MRREVRVAPARLRQPPVRRVASANPLHAPARQQRRIGQLDRQNQRRIARPRRRQLPRQPINLAQPEAGRHDRRRMRDAGYAARPPDRLHRRRRRAKRRNRLFNPQRQNVPLPRGHLAAHDHLQRQPALQRQLPRPLRPRYIVVLRDRDAVQPRANRRLQHPLRAVHPVRRPRMHLQIRRRPADLRRAHLAHAAPPLLWPPWALSRRCARGSSHGVSRHGAQGDSNIRHCSQCS